MKKVKDSISCLYFFILFAVYPFYYWEGYIQIGQAKYTFFKWCSVIFLTILLVLLICLKDISWSRLDYVLAGYLLINLLSFCASPYKDTAFFGAFGWNLGLFSQCLFVLLLFAAENWQGFDLLGLPAFAWMALAGAAGVFVLGILNRFSVYPIPMAGFNHDFISTLGNINWYSGYWSVMAPLGWGAYAALERKKEPRCIAVHICLGIYSFLAVLAGVTCGSASVYLVFFICAAVFAWRAFDGKKQLLDSLELLMIAALAMQAVRQLFLRHPAGMQYDSDVIRYFMFHPAGLYLLAFLSVIYCVVRFLGKDDRETKAWQRIRAYLTAVFAALVIFAGILFLLNSAVPGGIWPVRGFGIFYFSDIWGNGRGGIWKDTAMAFGRMTALQKMFGVGPDCYACFIYEFPEIAKRLISQFGSSRLTNAHNEWFSVLINTGIFGLLFYVGIFVTALRSFAGKVKEEPFLFAVMLCLLGYMSHNMVSFSQILSTPFVFLMIGLGQGLTKQADSHKVVNRYF